MILLKVKSLYLLYMSSIYIDANAANAKVIDPLTNNRWEYQINGGLELPTGTKISVASSFINQKGIAGGSIEIDEDIEEQLVYGYYTSDTAYSVPTTGDLMDLDDDFTDGDQHVGLDLAAPFNFVQNYLNQFINEGEHDYNNAKWAPAYARGRTENPLPLMTVVRTEYPGGSRFFKQQSANGYESTGWSYAVPLLNKSTIKIPKGIYTLQRLADIITKQLNGLELPDNVAKTQLQKQKENGKFNGILTNRNFARQARVEHSQRGFAGMSQTFNDPSTGEEVNTTESFDWVGGFSVRNHYFPKGSKQQVDNIVNFEAVGDDLNYSAPTTYSLTEAQYDNYISGENSQAEQDVLNYMRDNVRALTPDDDITPPTVFAVRPNFFSKSITYLTDVRDNVKLAPKYFATGTGFNHFDDNSKQFNPSLFCWRSDILANEMNLYNGNFSEYCHVFENNSVIPAVATTNFMGEGKGEIPNTMYFNSAAKADEGTPPALFNFQKQVDPERFASTNNFPNNAMTIGTTNFSIVFDDSDRTSLFSLEHLHEPRRIPTHDKFGNQNDKPSMECYYVQRTVDTFADINPIKHSSLPTDYPNLFYYQTDADQNQINTNVAVVNNNLNTIAQRIGGVMMRNFALSTAKKLRTVPIPDNRIANYDDFLTFDDFFNTKAEAKSAWNTSIWARLGFSYEQICSQESYEKVKFFNRDEETLAGFTTDAGVSSSVIPMISTLYTNEKATEVDDMGVPKFNAGVQYFNNADMNVPNRHAEATFTTDTDDPTTTQVNRVYQYQNSFYDYAVMGMVETSGKQIQARALPQLSKHGYFLITSNIGGMTDVVNDGDPVILLDTVPKSNLANQDFIFNRNDLVHTVSNPITLNSININILNPDLSNPTLAGDSSVLIRIDYPLPRETVIRQSVLDNQVVSVISNEVAQEEKSLGKK
jgi:hypothetical protein